MEGFDAGRVARPAARAGARALPGSMKQQAGSAGISCRVLQNTVTVNGFTVEFSGALPDGSSDVSWIAMQ